MTTGWDTDGDFQAVVDTLETVELASKACNETSTIPAWRFQQSTRELTGYGEAAVVESTIWQAPYSSEAPLPQVGDRLIDSRGACSIVVGVEELQGSTRVRFSARRLVLRSEAAEWFDLETETAGGEGVASSGWRTTAPALRGVRRRLAVIDPESPDTDSDYEIVLTEPIEASVGDRLRGHSGQAFVVAGQALAHNLGEGWAYETMLAS